MEPLMQQPLICPFCRSAEVMIRAPTQKTYAVIGCVVGATSGFNAALRGLHIGKALAAHVGPVGFAFTGIARALICALASSAIGAELGAKAGSKVDQALLCRYRCASCKQTF